MKGLSSTIRDYLRRTSRNRGLHNLGDVILATTLGRVRTENQDRVLHAEGQLGRYAARGMSLTVLCDGMGGMASGAEAAEIACSAFVESFIGSGVVGVDRRLTQALLDADKAVYSKLRGRGGSTLVALAKTEKAGWIASVGDSRLYAFHHQTGLQQVTRDDTLSEMLKRSGSSGHMVERGDQLVQFVGLGEGVEPHSCVIDVGAIDLLLLTSDGAHCIGHDLLEKVCRANSEPGKLAEAILAVSGALGGVDNSSIVVLAPRLTDKGKVEDASIRIFTAQSGAELTVTGPLSATNQVSSHPDCPNNSQGVVRDAITAGGGQDVGVESDASAGGDAHVSDGAVSTQVAKKKRKKRKASSKRSSEKASEVLSLDFPKDGQ